MRERELEDRAAKELEAAGFVIARDARPAPEKLLGTTVRADVCGWSAGESAELEPDVVVEVKLLLRAADRARALAQLSRVTAAFGARRAYLFDGAWHEANDDFTQFVTSSCPSPRRVLAEARVPVQLLRAEVWSLLERRRAEGEVIRGEDVLEFVLDDLRAGKAQSLARLCATRAGKLSLARLLCDQAGELAAPLALMSGLVRLLGVEPGHAVLDPMCRLGGSLWTVAEQQADVSLDGWWCSARAIAVAQNFAAFSGLEARFTCSSFDEVLSRSAQTDRLIALLPFGVKLRERVALVAGGRDTQDLDVGFLDRLPGWLKAGGRAVVVVPPRVLFADGAAEVRERLAREYRVVAVIELPGGIFDMTKIPVGILVLEKKPPTKSLVARLGADWVEQLAPGGEFFRAFEQHLASEAP